MRKSTPQKTKRRTQDERRRATQEAILKAAVALLVEEGYAKFSTISVAKRAGVSRGAASKYVPLENLCLSPQCGFASSHHGNKVTEEIEKRKLALVVEVAQEM